MLPYLGTLSGLTLRVLWVRKYGLIAYIIAPVSRIQCVVKHKHKACYVKKYPREGGISSCCGAL